MKISPILKLLQPKLSSYFKVIAGAYDNQEALVSRRGQYPQLYVVFEGETADKNIYQGNKWDQKITKNFGCLIGFSIKGDRKGYSAETDIVNLSNLIKDILIGFDQLEGEDNMFPIEYLGTQLIDIMDSDGTIWHSIHFSYSVDYVKDIQV